MNWQSPGHGGAKETGGSGKESLDVGGTLERPGQGGRKVAGEGGQA